MEQPVTVWQFTLMVTIARLKLEKDRGENSEKIIRVAIKDLQELLELPIEERERHITAFPGWDGYCRAHESR